MRKLVLPLSLFILGLVVAQVFFGVDVKGLSKGFLGFLADILGGPG